MSLFESNPFTNETEVKTEQNIFIDLLQTVVIALSICVVIYLFIATPNEVHGQSMEPNFYDGELLLTNKVIQYLGNTGLKKIAGDYDRGDVVIFHHIGTGDDFIKRVIGIEGDTVMVKDGHVFVNNVQIEEPYLPDGRRTEAGSFLEEGKPVKVPEDSYIVFGDNRGASTDSRKREVGFVNRSQMKGKVIFRYWPLNTFGVIHSADYNL